MWALLSETLGTRRLRIRSPIDVSTADRDYNEPDPDIAVLAELNPDFARRHPRGDELLLVVEIAGASLKSDSTRKRDLYARAGVPEYWVLDLPNRRLLVHREPAEGGYKEFFIVAETDTVALPSSPTSVISLALLLPV